MRFLKPKEGKLTRMIENKTAKVPSVTYLSIAVGSMVASATFKCIGKHKTALFIGQWAAPLLIMGLYNKIVKTNGHD